MSNTTRHRGRTFTPSPAVLERVGPAPERKNKTDMELAVRRLETEMEGRQNRMDALTRRIESKQRENASSGEQIRTLRNSMQTLTRQRDQLKGRLDSLEAQKERIREALSSAESKSKEARSKMRFRSVHEIEEEISKLNRRQATTTMTLGQEKSLLREIEALQHLKRDLDSLSDVRQTVEEKREERKGLDTMISEVRTSLRDVKRALSATFDELEQARGETDREAIDALHAEKREVYAEIKELRKQIRDERDAYYNSLRARKEWEDRAREEEEEERKRKEEEDKVKRAEWIEQRTDELLQKDPYLQEKQACDELIQYAREVEVKTTLMQEAAQQARENHGNSGNVGHLSGTEVALLASGRVRLVKNTKEERQVDTSGLQPLEVIQRTPDIDPHSKGKKNKKKKKRKNNNNNGNGSIQLLDASSSSEVATNPQDLALFLEQEARKEEEAQEAQKTEEEKREDEENPVVDISFVMSKAFQRLAVSVPHRKNDLATTIQELEAKKDGYDTLPRPSREELKAKVTKEAEDKERRREQKRRQRREGGGGRGGRGRRGQQHNNNSNNDNSNDDFDYQEYERELEEEGEEERKRESKKKTKKAPAPTLTDDNFPSLGGMKIGDGVSTTAKNSVWGDVSSAQQEEEEEVEEEEEEEEEEVQEVDDVVVVTEEDIQEEEEEEEEGEILPSSSSSSTSLAAPPGLPQNFLMNNEEEETWSDDDDDEEETTA